MAAPPITVRIDKWLWSVRVYRTRTAATDACATGRVTVNDDPAKPAAKVKVGDTITVRRRDRTIIYTVTALIDKRVSAALAADCYDDISPPPSDRRPGTVPGLAGVRGRGTGRPTKRDRRQIDHLRGRR